ncbi:MAG: AtpZ/AtpI family protein [Terriglobales bacterium]
MPESRKPPESKDPFVSLARYSEIGFIIPAAVLLGFFLGKLLDYWLHTKWLYLAGLLFGAVVGFTQMIRMALGATGKDLETRAPGSDPAAENSSAPTRTLPPKHD